MFFLFGTGLFGQVDTVPGTWRAGRLSGSLYVATQFFHISGFPLFPLGSYAVVAAPGISEWFGLMLGASDPVASMRVPFSLKSVVFAYLRAVLCVIVCVSVLVTLPVLRLGGEQTLLIVGLISAAAVAAGALRLTYSLAAADHDRQEELRELISSAGVRPADPAPLSEL